jgi:hypothetical protein
VGPPALRPRQPNLRLFWASGLLHSGGSDPGFCEPLPRGKFWICQECVMLENWPCRRGELDPVGTPRAIPSTLAGPLTRTTRFRPVRCDIGNRVGLRESSGAARSGPVTCQRGAS